jgi:hypothetical protein
MRTRPLSVLLLALSVAGWSASAAGPELRAGSETGDGVDYTPLFPAGSGSRFRLVTDGGKISTSLVISVAEVEKRSLRLEYFMSNADAMIPIELWQQFRLEASDDAGSVRLTEGYVFASHMKNPEKLPEEGLRGFDGVVMSDFLVSLSSKASRDRFAASYKGTERIQVPASGPKGIEARKFVQDRGGQVVTYWISDEARPIGLVKLVSTGAKPSQNYEVTLEAVVKGVKARINPAEAKPLTDAGRMLTALPQAPSDARSSP